MAHHLVDRHGAPARLILRRKLRHSTRYVLLFAEVLQGLHHLASQSSELRFLNSLRKTHVLYQDTTWKSGRTARAKFWALERVRELCSPNLVPQGRLRIPQDENPGGPPTLKWTISNSG